jgi:CubicO group peptidase (beta-lactamase class C family)
LLSKILEKTYQLSFKDIVKKKIIERLNLRNTFFGEVPHNRIGDCVPTELGNKFEKDMAEGDKRFKKKSENFNWRENLIIGEINDANAFYLEGNSGNAGLFSTTKDILKISNEFYPNSTSLLSSEITGLFWKNLTLFKKSHRTVGFKLNSSIITSGGRGISRKAIGHNGFTGVSIWFEPKTEYKFIILTNRIHPEVKPLPFNKIRRKLHKLIKKTFFV